jgi:sugar-specific transcriptional regulator TrmB
VSGQYGHEVIFITTTKSKYKSMYSEIFEEIGLSPNEAKIYETLLSTGETSVSIISSKAKVHRRNVYDALNRLVEKGLVFPIFQKGENKYHAVTPDKLSEMIEEKQKKLNHILPTLRKIYDAEPKEEAAYIYKGLEGFKNYMRDLVRVSEDTYFMGAKGLWFTPGIEKYFLTDFVKNSQKKKLKYFTLYDPRVKTQMPGIVNDVMGEYKFLPDTYSTPGVVDIFGDYVVTFTSVDIGNFGEDGTIFVMINKELAETYRTWFRMIWDFSP